MEERLYIIFDKKGVVDAYTLIDDNCNNIGMSDEEIIEQRIEDAIEDERIENKEYSFTEMYLNQLKFFSSSEEI